jgi:hypothetical protein
MAAAPKITVPDKKTRTRSPAYPFINLETALRRAREFYDQQQHHSAPVKVAAKLWGYEEKSSGGLQTTAAMVSFGLLSDVGTGFHRKVKLTEMAMKILLSPDPKSKEHAIKQVALAPKIHRQVWQRWGPKPPEASLRYVLLTEWEPRFNPNAVDPFIREYLDTIAFAKLTESDTVNSENSGDEEGSNAPYVPKIGDYVQWEKENGDLGFPEPKMVKGFSPDREWAYIESQNGCVPARELILEAAPSNAHVQSDASVGQRMQPPSKNTMQEMIVPLANSNKAVFQWPTVLTKEDVEDLKDSIKMLERKITRPAPASDPLENWKGLNGSPLAGK